MNNEISLIHEDDYDYEESADLNNYNAEYNDVSIVNIDDSTIENQDRLNQVNEEKNDNVNLAQSMNMLNLTQNRNDNNIHQFECKLDKDDFAGYAGENKFNLRLGLTRYFKSKKKHLK